MDSTTAIAKQILGIAASRRVRAFSIAVLILTTLAVLQVNNLKQNAPLCELLANSNLCNADLQRMQIALSQSGLDEYQLKDNRLMVPTAKHSIYLQAIAQQNAIPEELRQSADAAPSSINPFLSRSQQMAIERAEKKHQVRDMVLRLPFVEQAWFEMDKSDSHSAFEPAEQSAVVSIRTTQNVSLSDQHVDTVKRMIGGAVAGLDPEKIVVIDLSAGFAHDEFVDPSTSQQVHFQRIAIEQQRFYENQIREILKAYPGIQVTVRVDVKPTPEDDHVAFIPDSIPANALPVSDTPAQIAGANSYASIENTFEPDAEPISPVKIQLISHATLAGTSQRIEKQISVSIDVPQKLVHDLFGVPASSASFAVSRKDLQAEMAKDTNTKFEQLRSEIIQKIEPVLPHTSRQANANPITVNLIRDPLPESAQWYAQVQEFAVQNWPSAAVLIIGIMLLSIVTRKPDTLELPAHDATSDGDVLSIHTSPAVEPGSAGGPEVRLTKLIEKDPDAAARVIEAWIRDAA